MTTTSATPATDISAAIEGTGKFRRLGPGIGTLERALVLGLAILGGLWALEIQYYLPIAVFKEQYLGVIIALGLAAVFIGIKARSGEAGGFVPWYDWLAAFLSAVVGLYIAINYRSLVYDLGSLSVERYALGGLAILLVLEATRRTAGWPLVILAVVFMGYAKYSFLFPGLLNVPSPSYERMGVYLYLDSNGMLGTPLTVTATIIIAFILFGRMLYAVKGDQALTDFALALMGRRRGGPAKVAVIGSSLFGTISGSAISNVVMDGPITIPMMKRAGYPPHLAAAIEAVASTGGQIMPPVMGITAFLIADFLDVPYAEVVLAALIPAFLYYLAVFMQVDLEAAKRGISGLAPHELPRWRAVASSGWIFVIPIFVLIYLMFAENWQPGRAAMAAAITAVVAGFLKPETRPTWRRLVGALEETGRSILDLVVITLVAGIVIGALQISGLTFNFSLVLLALAGGVLILLLILTALACIVLGMGMPSGVIYVMLAVLVSPALEEMGVPLMAGHMFLLYFGLMSMITPPVCLATFAAASIAGSEFWKTGWAGVRLGIVAYLVPFAMVYQPALVFQGTSGEILVAGLRGTLGVIILSFGMVGYIFGPISTLSRLACIASGAVILLVPVHAEAAAIVLGAAAVVAGGTMFLEYRRSGSAPARQSHAAVPPGQ